jgi:hypothetical protein
MTNNELNKHLIKNFPNLKNAYDEEVSWQEGDDTGSHTVYGDILTPYLNKCLNEEDESEIKKILTFIERILELRDDYSDEVIAFSVLEGIEYQYRNSAFLNNNIGNLTKKIIEEIRKSND